MFVVSAPCTPRVQGYAEIGREVGCDWRTVR
jgi:hypothetical protein